MEYTDVFTLEWRDFEIEVSFIKSYLPSYEEIDGYCMSHIEIRTISPPKAALPITETGYRSIFMALPQIEAQGGVKTLVLNELNRAAEKSEWKQKEINARQYELF
ncbi:MAG: hypothetical protein ACRBCS_06720 [Cellvibrionaceae bacterium]